MGFVSPMHKNISDSYSNREGGNPRNSGLFVSTTRTMWKNINAEHEVTNIYWNAILNLGFLAAILEQWLH